MKLNKKPNISIIGMGYVGLPLAVEFKKHFDVVGFDIDKKRINNLKNGIDNNKQFSKREIKSKKLQFTNNQLNLSNTNIFIITVPTPLKKNNKPDLKPMIDATKMVGKYINKNTIIVYESTVFPGCTEEICAPILKKISKLNINEDFFLGYSPERINVGDKIHTLKNIKKIVSGSNKIIAKYLSKIYGKIINAGIYIASNIKVAEAAKVIENSQRDLNIAFVNELAKIFYKLKIDTHDVLKAAETKWNFAPYKPGLVGGHCISVDPYYLTFKAKKIGLNPKVILAGRKTNDNMASYVATRFHSQMKNRFGKIKNKKILILGLTFKENCPDIRNSKVFNVFNILKKLNYKINIHDPLVDINSIDKKYKKYFVKKLKKNNYEGALLLVPHKIFLKKWRFYKSYFKKNMLIFDLKNKLKTKDLSLKL